MNKAQGISYLAYRLKIRKELVKACTEHLNITYEECKREIMRRNNKK